MRELSWGLPKARREISRWRRRAETIECGAIREDALKTIATKRGHIDGAVLFTTLPARPNPDLLRLLVAYELIWDLLDTINERGTRSGAGQKNGRQLHLALIDAIDEHRPIADYYRYHPWKADGGYLRSLVEECRRTVRLLPSWKKVRDSVLVEAHRTQVLAINHEPDPVLRERDLKAWTRTNATTTSSGTVWYELSAAASASLTVHVLFALAATPGCSKQEISATQAAYFPWVSAATTMLDSYVDQHEDRLNGDHSYVSHYPTEAAARVRIAALLQESLLRTRGLPRGPQHALIIACMTAMYLSKDSARAPDLRDTSAELLRAGGTLTQRLQPTLRIWRLVNAQTSH